MNKLISWFCKIFIAPIARILFIKEIRGFENIPKENFVLASNHQSHLDQVAAGYVCIPRRFHFIGQTDQYTGLTKVLLYIIYFLAGVIRINRKNKNSKAKMMKEAIDSVKKGDCLIIYPEGTRTRTGQIGKAKHGVANIFLETGKPILPVGIKGTFELLPPGGKLKIKRIIEINVGKPLYFNKEYEKAKNMNKESEEYRLLLQEIANKTMNEIISLKSILDLKT